MWVMMKTLIYDIETAPIVATVWGKYEQNIVWSVQDWYMLCFAYKWLGEKKTYVISQTDFKNYEPGSEDDSEVLKVLHKLFDEADVVVAHNGDQFDQKKSQARMILNNLPPPAPYKQIDTKKVAKRYFNFTSNKLDDLGEYLELGKKLETGGHELWKGCMAGDMKAWRKMQRYNKQDVVLLEKVYLKMRPWIKNHPNTGIADGRPAACDNCGSDRMHQHTKKTYAKTGWKMQYKCYDCGAYKTSSVLHRIEDKTNRLN